MMHGGQATSFAILASVTMLLSGLAGPLGGLTGAEDTQILPSANAQVPPDPPSDGDGYDVITNQRVEMDDGVELSVDVYVPEGADRDGDGVYPCVVELTPYRKEGRAAEGASFLPQRGIALIEVDARGTGGSEGEYDIVFSVREQHDAANMVDWAAEDATDADGDPLCEDEVGMYGGSYSGIIQYLTASLPPADKTNPDPDLATASEHLAAIAPQRAYGDLYRDIVYHGGMVIGSFGVIWSQGTTSYYLQPPTDAEQPRGQEAYADHVTKNDNMLLPYLNNAHSDDRWCSDDSATGYCQDLYTDSSVLPRIENLHVPTLHLAGWWDAFTRGQLLTFQQAHALEQQAPDAYGPNFAIVGPWNHGGTHFITPDQGFRSELADWYHYWLEDRANGAPAPGWIANGFDGDGERLQYFQMDEPVINPTMPDDDQANGTWETAADWPVPGTSVETLHLREDGGLTTDAPGEYEGSDLYVYDPAGGAAETLSRWDNAAGTPQPRMDQRAETPHGLTYTTGPLSEALEVAGPIGMTLHASTFGVPGTQPSSPLIPDAAQLTPTYHDTDFVVKVSEVDETGEATLVTQGYLRASHAEVDEAESVAIDGELMAPFHPHTEASVTPPGVGEIHEYELEIWPTANTFDAGHELRIDVLSSDTPNHLALVQPAVNNIYHDAEHPSQIRLPVTG